CASQVAVGHENSLTLDIYGSKGALRWAQETPNVLWVTPLGQPPRMITRGSGAAHPAAAAVTRIPAGHPEGYLEAFATLYREAAEVIRQPDTPLDSTLGVAQGLEGVRFVDACQRSSAQAAAWITL
ncbi:MAG: Gfo/Idh/MocA family oxidoreductase, partial [Paracoccaceae bacterium]